MIEAPKTLEKEMETFLDRFDSRIVEIRSLGLKLWTGVLRNILSDMLAARRARDNEIYKELMLLESSIRGNGLVDKIEKASPAARDGLLERISTIKGMLSCLMLGFSLLKVCDDGFDRRAFRSRGNQIRVVQVVRHLGRKMEVCG